jgi:phosphoribosyl-ATP pyrophosphohydrolase
MENRDITPTEEEVLAKFDDFNKNDSVESNASSADFTLLSAPIDNFQIVDARGLNQNTWYPVTVRVAGNRISRIQIVNDLRNNGPVDWSRHSSAQFTVIKVWETIGSNWGEHSPIPRRVLTSEVNWTQNDIDPVRNLFQFGAHSREVFYVRGGGRYRVVLSDGADMLTLHPTGFTCPGDGRAAPIIAMPASDINNNNANFNNLLPAIPVGMSIIRPLHAPSIRLSSDKRLKENIKSYITDKSILDLDVKEFTFKDSVEKTIGILAQDLREHFPDLVKGSEGENSFLSIEETKLSYLLLLELKKTNLKLEKVCTELEELKKQIKGK